MSELLTIQKGQFRKKSQKGGEMEVKKWRQSRLRKFATCKISVVSHFSSVCGSNFLSTSIVLRVRLGFFMLGLTR